MSDDIIGYDEYEQLTRSEQLGVERINDPSGLFSPADIASYAKDWLTAMDLNENQAVFSLLGLDAIIQPRLADENGRGRLINTGSLETSALLSVYALNYLPNRQKIRPPDLNDTQWNMALHLMNQAAGGVIEGGGLNDVPKHFGIDISTQGGLGEVELALADKPSAFDAISLEVAEEQYQAIITYVRGVRAGGREDTLASVDATWRSNCEDLVFDVFEHKVVVDRLSEAVRTSRVGQPGSDDARIYIRLVADGVDLVVASGHKAGEALEGLRFLADSAARVAHNSDMANLNVVTAGVASVSERWKITHSELERSVGTLIQYLVNSVGASSEAEKAARHIEESLGALCQEANERCYDATVLAQAINDTLDGVLRAGDATTSGGSALRRPEWLT